MYLFPVSSLSTPSIVNTSKHLNIISSYRVYHCERMDLVWNALRKKSRPIYHLIDDVFPFVPENDVFIAVSGIFVHLEILINEGRAAFIGPGPLLCIRPGRP